MKFIWLHNPFCLSRGISFLNSRDNYFHAGVISSFPFPWRWVAWGNKDGPKCFLLKTTFFSPFSKVPQGTTMLLLLADLEAFKGGDHLNCSEFGTNHPLQPYSVLPFLPYAEASAELSSLNNPQHQLGSSPHNKDLLLATCRQVDRMARSLHRCSRNSVL